MYILFLVCYGLYFLGNNIYKLTDPDEVFYAQTAREMAGQHQWLTPLIFGQPQFEKPPLTYWLLDAAFKAAGETPYAARFFPAVFATLGVMAVYLLALMGFKDERKALLSALTLATGAFYAGMGKTVFTDMIFSVMILGAMAMFVWAYTDRRHQAAAWLGFYAFCALSTLAKSPLGFLMAQAAVVLFLLYQRQIQLLKNGWIVAGFALYLIVALPWYAYMYNHYGQSFLNEFFYNDHWRRFLEAEHKNNDHWFFYPVTMLAGIFPWSLFLLAGGIDLFKRLKSTVTMMDHLCLSWIIVVLLVFQMAHSKLASYILPLFPALALITGNYLGNALTQIYFRRIIQNLLLSTCGILACIGIAVIAAQKLYMHYIASLLPMIFLSACLIAIAGLAAVLALKERFQGALYVLALTLVPVFGTALILRPQVEGMVSSYEAAQYIPARALGPLTVLVTKANARGIYYYTGQDVAAVDFTGKQFFSPHPIPIFENADQIRGLIDHQPVTYAVVRKSAYKFILEHFSGSYRVSLLNTFGQDYVLRIIPNRRS